MRFITAGFRQVYSLAPRQHELMTDGAGRAIRAGVSVLLCSSNNDRIIDTEREANQQGWSDEERTKMEEHLLAHPDFATKRLVDRGEQRGDELLNSLVWVLYFAPDQGFPEEHRAFIERQPWFKAWGETVEQAPKTQERTCSFAAIDSTGVALRCPEPALADSDYCQAHLGEMAEVGS